MAGYKDDQVQNAFARIAQELSKKQQPKVTPYEQTIGARSQINTQDYAQRVDPTQLLQQYSDYGDQFDNRNIGSKALNTGRRAAGAFGELFEQAGGAIVNGVGAANTIGLDKNAETAFYKLQDQKNNTKYQEELTLLDDPTKALASGRYLDQRDINERKTYLTNRLQQNQLTPEEEALLYNPDGSETYTKQRLNWSKSAEEYGKQVTGDREKGIAGSLNARNWYDHTGEEAYQANKKYNGTSPRETAIAQRDARDAYEQGDYFGWATKHLGTFAKSAKDSASALLDNPAYLAEEAAGMAPYLLGVSRIPAVAVDATRVQNDSYDAFVERELRAPTTGESLGILGMTTAYTGANYAASAITAGALKGKSIASSLGLKSSSVPSAIEKTASDKIRNAALIQSAGQLGRSSLAEGATEAVQQQIEGNWGSLNNTLDSAAMGEAFTMGAAITGTIGTPAATANAVLGTGLQAKAALAERNLNKAKEDSPEIDQSIPTEEFASPDSPNFNPKAATVRMTQEAAQAETPEAKQEIKAKQEEVLQASASRLDILENIIESLEDVEGTRTGVEEFRAQVQSAKAADPSNPQVAQLEEALANADAVMAEIDANANDPEYAARVKKEYSGLVNQLNKATEVRNNSEALADDLSNNPTTIPSKILGAPSSYSAAELAKASKDVKYAEADREVLRTLSEARQAYDDTQSIKRVSKDIINGSESSKPIMSYMDDMSKAVASGNTRMQEVTSKMLDRFVASHQSKADTVMQAWEAAKAAPGTSVEVARLAGNPKWFINTGNPIKNSRENASLKITYNPGKYGHSESLVSAIAMESSLINKVKASVDVLAARSTNDTSDPMERMQEMVDSLDTSTGVDLEAQELVDEGRQQQAQANQANRNSIPQNTPVNPDENIWEGIDESSLQVEPTDDVEASIQDLNELKPDLSNTEIHFDESGVGSVVPTPSKATGTSPKAEGIEVTSGEEQPQQKKKSTSPVVNTPKKKEDEEAPNADTVTETVTKPTISAVNTPKKEEEDKEQVNKVTTKKEVTDSNVEKDEDNLPTREVRKFGDIEYIVDSTIPTMVRTGSKGKITLNPRNAENSKEFWDYFGGVVQEDASDRTKEASQQKKEVLAQLGVEGYSLDYLKQQLNTPRKLNEFLLRHAQSRVDSNETSATIDTLAAMGIEPKYEGNIDESFVSTSETPYEIYDIPLNENELKDMFGGLDTTTDYVPDFGTTVEANKEAKALREANKDKPLAEHDLVREAVNIIPTKLRSMSESVTAKLRRLGTNARFTAAYNEVLKKHLEETVLNPTEQQRKAMEALGGMFYNFHKITTGIYSNTDFLKDAGLDKFNNFANYLVDTDPKAQITTAKGEVVDKLLPEVEDAITIAAFSWIMENGSTLMRMDNLPKALGIEGNDLTVPYHIYDMLKAVGSAKPTAAETIGNKVIDMLGFKFTSDVADTRNSKLAIALGQLAVHRMTMAGYVEENTLEPEVVRALTREIMVSNSMDIDEAELQSKNQYTFINVTHSKNTFEPTELSAKVLNATKGSESVLTKAFGVAPRVKPIRVSKPKADKLVTQKTTDRLGTQIPTAQVEALSNAHTYKWGINKSLNQLHTNLAKTPVLKALRDRMYGKLTDAEINAKQAMKRDGIKANNQSIEREIQIYEASVDTLAKTRFGLDNDFYLEQEVQNQQRSHMANDLNPVASKLHRGLVELKDHRVKFPMTSVERDGIKTFFKTGNTEALLDSQTNTVTPLGEFIQTVALLTEDLMPEGVSTTADKTQILNYAPQYLEWVLQGEGTDVLIILEKMINGDSVPVEQVEKVVTTVNKAGMKAQSLKALVNLIAFKNAFISGKDTDFEVNISLEVDGVTNGPFLTQVLMNTLAPSMYGAGGMYIEAGGITNVPQYKDLGNPDMYEYNITHLRNAIALAPAKAGRAAYAKNSDVPAERITQEVLQAVQVLHPKMLERKGTKTITTVINFSSGNKATASGIIGDIKDSILSGLEKYSSESVDSPSRKLFIGNLNYLLLRGGLKENEHVKDDADLLNLVLTPQQDKAINKALEEPLMHVVSEFIKEAYPEYIKARDDITAAGQLAVGLFKPVYDAEVVKRTEALPEDVKKVEGLSKEAHEQVLTDLRKDMPTFKSYLAGKSTNTEESSLPLVKIASKRSEQARDKSEFYIFGARKVNSLGLHKDGSFNASTASKYTYHVTQQAKTYEIVPAGVANNPKGVHSTDAGIAHTQLGNWVTMNIHDALTASVGKGREFAKELNKVTTDALIEVDFNSNMVTGSLKPLTAFLGLDSKTQLASKAELQKAAQSINKSHDNDVYNDKGDLVPNSSIGDAVALLLDAAFDRDIAKLNTLLEYAYVNQYGLEGGEYKLVEADIKRIEEKLEEVRAKRIEAVKQLVPQAVQLDSTFGVVGAKGIYQDASVNEVTKAAEEKIETGVDMYTTQFYLSNVPKDTPVDIKVLNSAIAQDTNKAKDVNPNLATVLSGQMYDLVKKALPEQLEVRVLHATDARALEHWSKGRYGWFNSSVDGKPVIYLTADANGNFDPAIAIHELMHAVTFLALENDTPAAKEITALREQFVKFLANQGITPTDVVAYAIQNNHEFVSTVFERPEVAMLLNQMTVKATRKRGFAEFVKAISKLISQAFGLKPVELAKGEITGLEALIGSVLTLSKEGDNTFSYLVTVPSRVLGASLRKAQQSVKAMNLTDLMGQLKGTGTYFDAQLKETMDEFALPIFDRMDTGLFDSIGLSNDPESVWQDAIATNTTVTTDKAVLSGYILQPLERFAVEAVYAATKAVAKERGLSISYAELDKAFSQARNKIKPQDLFKGDWSKATSAEKATAQAKWDHLFKITQENDHLARFSSMVSGSAEVNALLANVKTSSGNKVSKDADVNEKVQAYVMKAVEFLAQLVSGVKSGAPVSEYVKSALKSVAKVDLKYRGGIVNEINERISKVENKIDDVVLKTRRKVAKKIPAMVSTTVPEVTLVRNVATSAIEGTLMDNLKGTREIILNNSEGKLGFWEELVNEMSDNTPFKDIIEKMMRHVKKTSQTKELEKEYTIKNVLSTFKDGGKKLKRKTRESLTHLMVADVSALLGGYTPKQIHRMYHNPEYLNSVISQQASTVMSLDTRGTQLISRSKDLARYMVTNLGPENNDLALNATLIAMGAGTANKIALKDVDPDLVAAIDSLVSLYAIRYTPSDIKTEISSVMDTELSRGDVNGIEAILKFHKGLADEARDELFKDNPLSMTKGYIPEITNPNHEIRFAKTDEEAKNFKDQFFREVKVLEPNPLTRGDKVRMFLSEDAGLTRMVSGTLELFGKNPRGTDADVDVSVVLKASQAKQRSLHANSSYDPYKGNGTSALIPKYDLDGNVIGYRYEMSSYERDNLLGRDNDFANILGQYAATNFNKMNVPFNNRMVVDALVKEKQENYDAHPDRFVTVGFNVRDKELAKLWDLLPQDTRDYVREITGKSVLYVPKEVLLPVFGYQKYSATQGFDKPRSERNLYEKVYVALFKAVFGNNARVYGARTERGMQSAVALTKNFIVIRNLRTMAMNIISNTFLLQAHGIGLADIVKDTVYALRAGMQHRKDNALLTAKRQMLYTGLGNQKKLEQEVLRLEQAIANNPLAEFINEGMMPSIVDDVALNQDDTFSFKSALERKFEKQLNNIPAGVRTTAEWLMVSPSTPLYQFLNNTTQLSDFTSKYVMYNYYRNNVAKKGRLDHDAAIQIASDNFINYDMPTSKGMQYLNDMGIIMFSKYNLRIQKALFRLLERKPARALLQALVMHNGTDIPYGIDPIIWNQLGIPFREGAFAFPSVIDEPITMNMATSIL